MASGADILWKDSLRGYVFFDQEAVRCQIQTTYEVSSRALLGVSPCGDTSHVLGRDMNKLNHRQHVWLRLKRIANRYTRTSRSLQGSGNQKLQRKQLER